MDKKRLWFYSKAIKN